LNLQPDPEHPVDTPRTILKRTIIAESRVTIEQTKVVKLPTAKRMLDQAKVFLNDLELFMQKRREAVPVLLRAIRFANRETRHKIILLLATFAKQSAAQPLYRLMTNPREDEDIRRDASIQLSVIFPFLENPQPFIDGLLGRLQDPDPEMRENAAFALGWEGNHQAALPLIELLYDADAGVQQAAVNALSNLRDDRIFRLLIDRLENGAMEQKRSILYNLWRFDSKKEEVVEVYRKYLGHESQEMRFDALVLLGTICAAGEILQDCRQCLEDSSAKIRTLALKKIGETGPETCNRLRHEIEPLLQDTDSGVIQAAIQALRIQRPAS
jgi:HEAT repeat protein